MPISWSELLSALTVFSAVVGGVQYFIAKTMIDPMMTRQAEQLRKWAEATFPNKIEFTAHVKADENHQSRVEKEVDQLWNVVNKIK